MNERNSFAKIYQGGSMPRIVLALSVLFCGLIACSSNESSSSSTGQENLTEKPVDSQVEDKSEIESMTTSPAEEAPDSVEEEEETEEVEVSKPTGILRVASETFDAKGLGGGILQPLGAAPLPDGFTEVELLVAGEATSYRSDLPLTLSLIHI